MKRLVTNLWKKEEGQDLVEYALLLTLIALALVVSIQNLATAIAATFASAGTKLAT